MKLNFGHGILLFILLFMTGIIVLVYQCSKHPADLVSASYYEQELKYSDQMMKEKNALLLADEIRINYNQNQRVVVFNFPAFYNRENLSGKITFYKPDNARLDFSKQVLANDRYEQVIETSGMAHGYWNVQVNWKAGETPYYSEAKIFIN